VLFLFPVRFLEQVSNLCQNHTSGDHHARRLLKLASSPLPTASRRDSHRPNTASPPQDPLNARSLRLLDTLKTGLNKGSSEGIVACPRRL
jgi:hypothetical protein